MPPSPHFRQRKRGLAGNTDAPFDFGEKAGNIHRLAAAAGALAGLVGTEIEHRNPALFRHREEPTARFLAQRVGIAKIDENEARRHRAHGNQGQFGRVHGGERHRWDLAEGAFDQPHMGWIVLDIEQASLFPGDPRCAGDLGRLLALVTCGCWLFDGSRMTNTIMLNGKHAPEDVLASVKKGLYAVNFGGGQVDITSGKFVFSASEAYLIEDGKIGPAVKGATLIGNGPDVLTKVGMIGNDMKLDTGVGTCGKEGQGVPVGVGQPTLRIDALTVGGTAA